MKIYVAAEYGRMAEMNRDVVPKLETDGHEVTSRWLNRVHGMNQAGADEDLEDVDRADAVLVVTNPLGTPVTGGGRWFEAGYAYARGKRVIFVGEAETVFCCLADVEVCPDLTNARIRLSAPASRVNRASSDPWGTNAMTDPNFQEEIARAGWKYVYTKRWRTLIHVPENIAGEVREALSSTAGQEWPDAPKDGLEWNYDLDAMPVEGRFEALAAYREVFRHLPDEVWVVIPKSGRMFVPYAWRPAPLAAEPVVAGEVIR